MPARTPLASHHQTRSGVPGTLLFSMMTSCAFLAKIFAFTSQMRSCLLLASCFVVKPFFKSMRWMYSPRAFEYSREAT